MYLFCSDKESKKLSSIYNLKQLGNQVLKLSPMAKVLPFKIVTEVCNFHYWYTSTVKRNMAK